MHDRSKDITGVSARPKTSAIRAVQAENDPPSLPASLKFFFPSFDSSVISEPPVVTSDRSSSPTDPRAQERPDSVHVASTVSLLYKSLVYLLIYQLPYPLYLELSNHSSQFGVGALSCKKASLLAHPQKGLPGLGGEISQRSNL